jgi:hypothetical protein
VFNTSVPADDRAVYPVFKAWSDRDKDHLVDIVDICVQQAGYSR